MDSRLFFFLNDGRLGVRSSKFLLVSLYEMKMVTNITF